VAASAPARTPPRLVALTPGRQAADVATLERGVAAALEAGLPGVLLREPARGDRELLALATALRARTAEHGAWLGVHDRLHVALAVGADAVHLGFRSLSPAAARAALAGADGVALGLSAHAGDDAERWAPADYLVFGPVRATPKDPPVAPVGFEALAQAVRRAAGVSDGPVSGPVFGIGGLEPCDVGPALDAGAAGVFVLRGVLAAPDPAAAVRAYLGALAAADAGRGRGAAAR
jgi:thiamine-phosphate pyrophosphorylase